MVRSLDVLVDVGVMRNGQVASCEAPNFAILLDGRIPSDESFRSGVTRIYTQEDIPVDDRDTVFGRVFREQSDLERVAAEMFGQPLVKSVQYVSTTSGC